MKSLDTIYVVIMAIVVLCSSNNLSAENVRLPFKSEKLSVETAGFRVVGELYMPTTGEKHPTIIYVAGDGPSSREDAFPMLQTYGYLDLFLSNGFAVLIYDKPGCGESSGEFSRNNLFHERAVIVSRWVEELSNHPRVNPDQIGLAGGSQAGYVIPLVWESDTNIAFLICQSCPATNSIEQSAFLIREQSICMGMSSEDAEKAQQAYTISCTTDTYSDYLEAATYLASHPIVKSLGWDYIQREEEFQAPDGSEDSFFNPADIIEKYDVPFLALFGEKDTLIDPSQGFAIYQRAVNTQNEKYSEVHMLPDVDHTISLAETGCLHELMKKRSMNKVVLCNEAQIVISNFLIGLREYFSK